MAPKVINVFTLALGATVFLTGCQKAKMSSKDRNDQTISREPVQPNRQPPPGRVTPPPPPQRQQPPVGQRPPPGPRPGMQPQMPPPRGSVPPPIVRDDEPRRVPPRRTPPTEVRREEERREVETQPVVSEVRPRSAVTSPQTPTYSSPSTIVHVGPGQIPVASSGSGDPGIPVGGNGTPITYRSNQGVTPVFLGPLRVVTPLRSKEILSTCREQRCAPPEQTFVEPGAPPPPQQLRCPEIPIDPTPKTTKLDILFVVDTSDSMKEEHQFISRQITELIKQLTPDVTYQVGVLLGHGPTSTKAKVGELYVRSGINDVAVIKQADILRQVKATISDDTQARTRAAQLVSEALLAKMTNLPQDDSKVQGKPSTQGEAGLLNLYKALKDGVQRDRLKQQGMLADGTSLMVVFVADENDVCYEYKADEKSKRRAQNAASLAPELRAFEDGETCRTVANGQRLTPEIVYQTVKQARGDLPVMFTGILYLDDNIPKKNDKWQGDNEMGRGYLDVISLGLGKAGSLATSDGAGNLRNLNEADFGKVLGKLGEYSNFSMKHAHVFPMQNVRDVSKVAADTVNVYINNPDGSSHHFNPSNVKLDRSVSTNTARVIISYEHMAKAHKDGLVKVGSVILITYKLVSGGTAEPGHDVLEVTGVHGEGGTSTRRVGDTIDADAISAHERARNAGGDSGSEATGAGSDAGASREAGGDASSGAAGVDASGSDTQDAAASVGVRAIIGDEGGGDDAAEANANETE